MLQLEKITYTVKDKALNRRSNILDCVSADIDDGKYVVITGPNGGGKTSLAHVIMGIYTPDSGRILYNGVDITGMSVTERSRVGISYGFQHPPRFKGMTVRDLLQIASGKNLSKHESCNYLTKVGLCASDYLTREIDASLSGGELKRIEIASILATEAPLMIFDEPEAGIDLWSFHRLTNTFREFHDKSGTTLIIISHQERIIKQADEVLLISEGNLVSRGTPEEILPEIEGIADKACCKISNSIKNN